MEKYFAEVPQIAPKAAVVKGRIIDIRANEVLVDIGYKSEGIIPKWGVHGAGGFETRRRD